MQRYLRSGFVRAENLAFESLGDGFIRLSGVIECAADIYIDVEKRLAILGGDGAGAIIQTVDYSYNAYVRNIGNIVRYDSPHDGHNEQHHCHRFDTFANKEIRPPTFLPNEDDWPTLGEVIGEVERWYYDNIDRLLAARIGKGR